MAKVSILSLVGVDTVSSSCSYDASTGMVSGTTKIIGGELLGGLLGGLLSGLTSALPVNPAPNTTIAVPGLATITLNRQVNTGGTLEVDALSVSLLGKAETITVATSLCNSADLSAS